MGKSKTRRGRRLGPAPKVHELATKRASKNFVAMVSKRATEGLEHRLTLELPEGKVSTLIAIEEGEAKVADPTVTEFLMTCLTMERECSISLETFGSDGRRHVRVWFVGGGSIHPMRATEVALALETSTEQDEQTSSWLNDPLVELLDAYRLT